MDQPFLWCARRDSPLLPLARANWLSLSLKLSLATNSPPDCLFNAATLSGSRPFFDINKKTDTHLGIGFTWCARRDSTPCPLDS